MDFGEPQDMLIGSECIDHIISQRGFIRLCSTEINVIDKRNRYGAAYTDNLIVMILVGVG